MFQIKKRTEFLQSLNQFLNTLYSEITEQLEIVSPILVSLPCLLSK